jgi:hypothetical protein
MEVVLPKSTIVHLELPKREHLLSAVLPEDLWHVLLHLDRSLFVSANANGVLRKQTALLQQVCPPATTFSQ